MRITSVEPITVTFELGREPMSFCFVKITTDDGLIGYGEACDSYGCSYASVLAAVVSDAFAPLLIGQEIVAVEPLADRMRLFTRRRLGDTWIAAQARSGIEIALCDLAAQAAGRSVSAMLGQARERVAVYASSTFLDEGPAPFHYDLITPLLERGVRMVKVRSGPNWQSDLAKLAELRSMVGDEIELMIDGSETYTLPTAVEISKRLADLGIRWFEEPIPQGARAAIKSLCEKAEVPIAYGEHLYGHEDALEALSNGGVSVLQPDASISGGILATRQIAGLASYYGARVVLHVCAGPISLAANLHVAGSVPSIRAVEYPLNLIPVWETLGDAPFSPADIVAGELAIPAGPGLGVRLVEAEAASRPYRKPGTRVAGTVGGLPDRFVGDR
jgi:L-alanine-DL-glutamate epimerase-like enolase superfamily enzyme